jgi:heme-degrading monooxygenase HmoA
MAGEIVTVFRNRVRPQAWEEYEPPEEQRAWREHPEHRAAQRAGVDRIYSEYRVQVCVLQDERRFTRPA